jgi:hypothetical protein
MDTSRKVAVIAAMPLELAPLTRGLRRQRIEGFDVYETSPALIVIGCIGETAARRASEFAVRYARPEWLINAGLAGAVSSQLRVGNAGRVREIVDVATGKHYRTSGGEWLLVTGAIVSGPESKQQLSATYGADVVDMEGAAIAQVAQDHGLKVAVLKAISDVADFVLPPLGKFVEPNGTFGMKRFLAYIALRPRWWSAVNKLRRNSRLASVNLCSELSHLIESLSNSAGAAALN